MKTPLPHVNKTTTKWHLVETFPKISDGFIQLWHLTLPKTQHLEACLSTITREEAQRAKSFMWEIDALRFALGRAGLRALLAAHFSLNPLDVQIAFNGFGKPLSKLPGIHFNISHSGSSILWALSGFYELGVDVESTPIKRIQEFCSMFSQQEMQHLSVLAHEPQVKAFYRLWARKEACLKATGLGFGLEPRQIEVLSDEVLLPAVPEIPVERLYLCDVATPSGETAAVAISAPRQTLQCLDLSSVYRPYC